MSNAYSNFRNQLEEIDGDVFKYEFELSQIKFKRIYDISSLYQLYLFLMTASFLRELYSAGKNRSFY